MTTSVSIPRRVVSRWKFCGLRRQNTKTQNTDRPAYEELKVNIARTITDSDEVEMVNAALFGIDLN